MIKKFVMDVDGVLNTGHILYSKLGKTFKIFGPHDKDGIAILKKYKIDIHFITADKTGWSITYRRIIKDWKFSKDKLHLVSEEDRMLWFQNNCDFNTTAFMGDGFHDAPILSKVKLGIAPISGRTEAKKSAKFITESPAGSGAVLDACLYIEKVINGLEKI